MKVAYVSKSLGHEAGGLLPVMQAMGGRVSSLGAEVHAFGVRELSNSNLQQGWNMVETTASPWLGPHALGYSPDLLMGMQKFSPDLLHVHGVFHYTSVAAKAYAAKADKRYVVSPHGMLDPWALKNSHWKKVVFGLMFERSHLKGASCIHSLCASETEAVRAYGLNNPICEIPNGIDLPNSSNRVPSPWIDNKKHEKKVLLFLGRIHPKKGLNNLVRAWASVQKECKSAKGWLLGIAGWDQCEHEQELKTLALDHGVQDSVLFMGAQYGNDKAACYQNANGFVLPSLSEGLPMVVLEAWSYKLPVLMTPQCNLQEGFVANAALEFLPEVHSIEKKLRSFFSMPDSDRQVMGQNGYDLVKDKFSWDSVATQIYSVYEWILGGGPPPSCIIKD